MILTIITKLSNFFINLANRFLPSPFVLTILLSGIVFIFTFIFTKHTFFNLISFWEKGFWQLLLFSMQMSLILILGYVLANSPFITSVITKFVSKLKNPDQAVLLISLTTLLVSLINWGLGLIFGAVLVRKYGEYAKANKIKINYPLAAAAAYSGLIIWHGGFSGSAPLSVASDNLFNIQGLKTIPISNTILSYQNILTSFLLISIVPTFLYLLSKHSKKKAVGVIFDKSELGEYLEEDQQKKKYFNDIMDNSSLIPKIVAIFLFLVMFFLIKNSSSTFGFVTLNFVNLSLFALSLYLYGSLSRFSTSFETATKSAAGIIMLFPFYAGIMGLMNYSGITAEFSKLISEYASKETFPLFSFISSGLVNLFVPSGGGQWAVQGPLLIQSSIDLDIPVEQTIMAFAYGDELTNMLQPFWALPLLGITQVKAKEIIPYSLMIMLIAIPIFILGIYLF